MNGCLMSNLRAPRYPTTEARNEEHRIKVNRLKSAAAAVVMVGKNGRLTAAERRRQRAAGLLGDHGDVLDDVDDIEKVRNGTML